MMNEVLVHSSHTAQTNSPRNIFTGMPLQMQWLCCGLTWLCQRLNHVIECVKGVSTQDKIQQVFFKSHVKMGCTDGYDFQLYWTT